MKRIYFIYAALIGILIHSCQTVNITSIDYLVPADIYFPDQIKRVGIVNNADGNTGHVGNNTKLDSMLMKKSNGLLEIYTLNGNSGIATESLAESVAAGNYFDEVVICDSALRASNTPKLEPILAKETVGELIKDLDVDMLIVLEEVRIKVKKQVYPMGEMGYLGSIDANVYPKISLHLPNRNTPLVTINGNDSIFWEDMASSVIAAHTKIITDEQLVNEASDFAGTIQVKHILPHWNTANRFYFMNGSSEMRDAAFLMQTNEWDKAFALWEQAYEKQKGKKKAQIASNISLYHEIKDDLEKAEEWGLKALELIKATSKTEEYTEGKAIPPTGDYARIYYNLVDLLKRKNDFSKLKIQMNRFNDDF